MSAWNDFDLNGGHPKSVVESMQTDPILNYCTAPYIYIES